MRLIILPLIRRVLLLTTLVSAIGSMLAFDQFYIMTSGGPRGQTFTAVYWIYQNSFVSFKLGYGAALSIVLTLIILVFSALQIALTARSARDMTARRPRQASAERTTRRPRGARKAPARYLVAAVCVAVIALMAAPIVLSFLASIKTAADASALAAALSAARAELRELRQGHQLSGGACDLCRQLRRSSR